MHILIAPNSFKGSLTADLVAEAIDKGLKRSGVDCTTKCFPIGDGGDGTGALLRRYMNAKDSKRVVHDPIGKKIKTSVAITPGKDTAIVELADASGLRLLRKNSYDPLHATSFGTGELIEHALKKGARKILLCIGGSATVDGGMGIIQALGGKFYSAKGKELRDGPISLPRLKKIDLAGVNKNLGATELIVLCDVENKLLGKQGSAAVFGPQKGASKKDVRKLEQCLEHFRDVVLETTGKDMATIKYGGAAGGVAAGLHALLNAKLVNGIDHFLDITGFDEELGKSDLLITGEGSIDKQTLHGKAPFGAAKRAKERSLPVIALAGKVPLKNDPALQKYFDVLLPISHETMDIETAMKNTYQNLERSAKVIGELLKMQTLF